MHIPLLDEKDLVLFSAVPPLWRINMGKTENEVNEEDGWEQNTSTANQHTRLLR